MSQNKTSKKKELRISNYSFEDTLGQGTFGKVRLGTHIPTGEKVAIKILEKSKIRDEEDFSRLEKEIKYLKSFNHPNIIQIYEIKETDEYYFIIMEYANGGELFNYIVEKDKLSEEEASYYMNQIIDGLEEIHAHKICHRDIKPENLLLTNNKEIKIIDFGLSNEYDKYLDTPCGSPCYAAPEMIRGQKYKGMNIDIWASGITLFAMVCGYLPFDEKDNEELFAKILECKVEFPEEKENLISDSCQDLILKILTPNPNKRISLDGIKDHPFLEIGKKFLSHSKKELPFFAENSEKDRIVINYMVEYLGIDNDGDVIQKYLRNNRHNNITTTFKLLKKKLTEQRWTTNCDHKNHITSFSSNIGEYKKIIPNKIKSKKLHSVSNNIEQNSNLSGKLSVISELNTIIKENKRNNNIIIINNNNMIPQDTKIKPIYDNLLSNTIKSKEIKKDFNTSVSKDKVKKSSKASSKSKKNSVSKSKNLSIITENESCVSCSTNGTLESNKTKNIKVTKKNGRIKIPLNLLNNNNKSRNVTTTPGLNSSNPSDNYNTVSSLNKRANSDDSKPNRKNTTEKDKVSKTEKKNYVSPELKVTQILNSSIRKNKSPFTSNNYNKNNISIKIKKSEVSPPLSKKTELLSARAKKTEISPSHQKNTKSKNSSLSHRNVPENNKNNIQVKKLPIKIPKGIKTESGLSPSSRPPKPSNTIHMNQSHLTTEPSPPSSQRVKRKGECNLQIETKNNESLKTSDRIVKTHESYHDNKGIANNKKIKNGHLEHKNFLVIRKPKNTSSLHFITSTQKPSVIKEKIFAYCKEKGVTIFDLNENKCIASIDNMNRFEVEIEQNTEGCYSVKFFHSFGNEEITKKFIKTIIGNVDI